MAYLALTRRGELGVISARWDGWRLVERWEESERRMLAVLVTPDGQEFEPGELNVIPYLYARLASLQRRLAIEHPWPGTEGLQDVTVFRR